jgi:hypothetical protein
LHIYVDETGDTGFKLHRGSSKIFSITMVIFNDPLEIEKTTRAVKRLQEQLKFTAGIEWKFSKTSRTHRIEFFKAIRDFKFEVRSVVMVKENIYGRKLKTHKDHFYNYSCKLVLQYALPHLEDAKIIFDKRGNREFYTSLRTYLRTKCNLDHTRIKEIKSKDSRKEIPLQMADMIAGAIGRSFGRKAGSSDYMRIIEKKIVNLFTFPDDLHKGRGE